MKVLVTGATGFIGQLLVQRLLGKHSVIALRRAVSATNRPENSEQLEWRSCDLFSLVQTEEAVREADVAVYLVHSMLPTARLTQSDFADTDLLLADNFARACARNGIHRIVYLGGLIPEKRPLSAHLASRLEVETALAAHGAEVITLRAGLVLGGQGSSFQMLSMLVRRLPVMICPAWTRSLTQPIGVRDTLALLENAIEDRELPPGSYDIGGPTVLSYQQLMAQTARVLGVRRRFFFVPFFSPGLSLLWVRLITGASRNLVAPLVQSLRHEMIVKDATLLRRAALPPRPLTEDLREALGTAAPSLRSTTSQRAHSLRGGREVRSIQRLPLPPGSNAIEVALEYFRWLPRFLAPVIRVRQDRASHSGLYSFCFIGLPLPLLQLEFAPDRSTPDRALYWIRGGLLVSPRSSSHARLEFREVLKRQFVLAAIHDFKPRLPWILYACTQAVLHLLVMRGFGRHLRRSQVAP